MFLRTLFLLAFIMGSQCKNNGTDCLEKEKSIGVLDIAKEAIEKVMDILPNCTDDFSANSPECGKKEKALALLEIAIDMILRAKHNSTCPFPVTDPDPVNITDPDIPAVKPIDCTDVLQQGYNISGVYRIWPTNDILGGMPVWVYCDMDTDDGGWTVIQRRGGNNTREDFYRDWIPYKKGFGDIKGEFWLGNDNIYALTNQASYSLRIDLEDVEGIRKHAIYDTFLIANETDLYRLNVTGYSGDAGDSLKYENGGVFCTKDKTNNRILPSRVPCTVSRHTGWWFKSCNKANLNGLPSTGDPTSTKNLFWKPWKEYQSLASADMKLRRKSSFVMA